MKSVIFYKRPGIITNHPGNKKRPGIIDSSPKKP